MSGRRKREEWLQDITQRQRNVVFPDTVNNEARFWRNIMEGTQRLTAVQRVGIGLFALSVVALVFMITFVWNGAKTPVFSWTKLVSGIFEWVFAFMFLGIFLLIFRLSQRRDKR
jgi:hypothetical protein